MIDLKNITIGAELEIADCDTRIQLPKGNTWCKKDFSIMNSSGVANDPLKKFNKYGGEIQTKPADTPEKLLKEVINIYNCFPKYEFNFTTNLHVHIKVQGLNNNLKALKMIASYLRKYDREIFNWIEPIAIPSRQKYFLMPEAYKGAYARYKRRLRSHHYRIEDKVYKLMMDAKTPEEFNLAHAKKDKNGKPLWYLVVRAGVNLKQLWEDTETIEFRHFTMSKDPLCMLSAFKWPKLFLNEIFFMGGRHPKYILQENPDLKFQSFFEYNYELDKIFKMTNLKYNSRKKIKQTIDKLIKQKIIKREDII